MGLAASLAELIAGLVSDEKILPKMFMGGDIDEYRIIVGKNSTYLTEHIPTGKKVPAIEAGGIVKDPAALPINWKPIAGAGAAVVVVGGVGAAVYLKKRGKKKAEQASIDIDEAAAEQQAESSSGESTATDITNVITTEAVPVIAGSDKILAPATQDHPEPALASPTHNKPQARVHGTPGTPRSPGASMSAGTSRRIPIRRKHRSSHDSGHESGHDSRHEPTQDRGISKLDWHAVTSRELDLARDEEQAGQIDAGIGRLTQLLLLLDEVPGKNGSPLYPEITVEPLLALVEMTLTQAHQGTATEAALPPAAAWADRLSEHAQATGNGALRFRTHLLSLRLTAWYARQTGEAPARAGWLNLGVDIPAQLLPSAMDALTDIAEATGDTDEPLRAAGAAMSAHPDPNHEDAWYRATVGVAKLVSRSGDQQTAQRMLADPRHALHAHQDAPWVAALLTEVDDLIRTSAGPVTDDEPGNPIEIPGEITSEAGELVTETSSSMPTDTRSAH